MARARPHVASDFDHCRPVARERLPRRRLEPAQRQRAREACATERNTRDISKSAEDVPNSAEVVGQLLKAAGKMERAIVFLRDRKLTDAYEPPQVEALAALEDAKQRVDKMKDDVDNNINNAKKEAIRQQYVKIKEEQDALNGETTAIETSRDPQGQLNRLQDVRLNQLPGVQGGLADRVKKIDEVLSSIGSIVYSWANQDIIKSMGEVKDQLGQRQTGVPTQAEQKRISDQLQAMIDNLAEHPVQSKFAQDGGGGGGQGQQQGPRLPTEAELRLLKAFQQAVNTETKALAAQKEKDKPGLLATGNRQGELRNLLGQLLDKASQGQVKLGPEPDNRDQLPEEVKTEDVENQELDKELLTGDPTADKIEKQTNLVGDRMARSRQRLAINDDPGKTTQIIQDRILLDLDNLIEQSRRQLAQARNMPPQPGEQQPQPQGQPKPQQANNQGQPQQQVASNPAQTSRVSGQQHANAKPGGAIKADDQEWGKISPRLRQAIMEGGSDQPVEEYKRLIEDYYKAVSTKQTERQ